MTTSKTSKFEDMVIKLAGEMQIKSKETGKRIKWSLNDEQKTVISSIINNKKIMIFKGRQIGCTTCTSFVVLMLTLLSDDKGGFRSCVVLDSNEKAFAALEKYKDFCDQLGVSCKLVGGQNDGGKLVMENNNTIKGYGANSERIGASKSYDFIHMTETSFWRDTEGVFESLMPTLSYTGKVIVETTASSREDILTKTWSNKENDWHKVFFSVEDHKAWRDYDYELSDKEWRDMQREGFTIKEAAAWFLRMQRNTHDGNMVEAFRQYPQLPKHLFAVSEGRYIGVDPITIRPVNTVTLHEYSPIFTIIDDELDIYIPPDESCTYTVGVDTAAGLGKDSSSVVVTKQDGKLCASYTSTEISIEGLSKMAWLAQEHYSFISRTIMHKRKITPLCYIETNGVGAGTYQTCKSYGMAISGIVTKADTKRKMLFIAKKAVESGILFGPERLLTECRSLRTVDGKFKGCKDLLMSYGMARLKVYNDFVEKKAANQEHPMVYLRKRLLRKAAKKDAESDVQQW